MNLFKLIDGIETEEVFGSTQMNITGIAFDSREVKPGNLFICISGYTTDGHMFAPKAVENGAAAIVAEKDLSNLGVTCIVVKNSRYAMAKIAAAYYDYPYKRFKLLGVTGTNGKTTSTYLIKSVLESLDYKVGLIGTNQNMIGDTVIPTERTTPDSLTLMQLFDSMANEGADYVVMEVSSHALALDRVTACTFDVGAFTNITQDHLDFHKTMEEYLQAKSILFTISKLGAINADDIGAEYLLENQKCDKVLTYGINNECDVKATEVDLKAEGISFDVSYKDEKRHVDLAIPGRFSVYNALTAITTLLCSGISLKEIADGLSNAEGVKGRIEVVEIDEPYTVIIDYAHTPDGLLNVINTVRDFAKGRVITLFGCGGDRDISKRPKMGKIATSLSDYTIITSDNPRSEDPEKIIDDILVGAKEGGGKYTVVPNRFEAIEYALDFAEPDDIIILAGKGHETYQVLADSTITFDEREIVKKLLGSM